MGGWGWGLRAGGPSRAVWRGPELPVCFAWKEVGRDQRRFWRVGCNRAASHAKESCREKAAGRALSAGERETRDEEGTC